VNDCTSFSLPFHSLKSSTAPSARLSLCRPRGLGGGWRAARGVHASYGRPYGHSDTGRCSLYQVGAYATGSYLALPQSLRCLRRPLGVCGVAVGSKREFVIM